MHRSGDEDGDDWSDDPVARAAAVAAWGLDQRRRPAPAVIRALVSGDPDARVRAAALGALIRRDPRGVTSVTVEAWRDAIADPTAAVRARAAELAPAIFGPVAMAGSAAVGAPDLLLALEDADAVVAEAAAFALGELAVGAVAAGVIPALAGVARRHSDPLVREAAVAALGSLGDPGGLAAVLEACSDKPAVRRRAVLALAAFDGPEVSAAIERALTDRDWQVRQAAEDLTAQ